MSTRPLSRGGLGACALLLAFGCGVAAASPAFDAMLKEAEAVRSADPARFQSLLGELNARVDEGSDQQREQLQYLKAYDLAYSGRFDLALAAATRLAEDGDHLDTRARAGALLVNLYAITREFDKGLRALNATLPLVDSIRDPEVRHHVWSAAGVIHNQVGQYERGGYFADLMLADSPSARTRCFAGTIRLESDYNLGGLDGQAGAIEEMVDRCLEVDEPVAANFARGHLARLLARESTATAALTLLETHLDEVEATRYPRLIGEIHSVMAELYLARGDEVLAEHHARQTIERSTGNEYSLPLVAAYRVMYEAALARGDTEAALAHLQRYAQVDKAYLDTVKAREMAFQIVSQETEQKTQQIALLNNQNLVLQLEQEVARQDARNTQLLVALMALLLAFIGYFAWKTKKMQVSFRRLAEVDTLTGISNRHHFSRRAEEVLAQCRRSGEAATLVMFDLDEFKSINDRFGHPVGDWVLARVAEACRAAGRHGDLFGRLGGEEFAFLLPGAGVEAGTKLAEDCRRRLHAIDSAPTGHAFPVSASFGVVDTVALGHDFHALLANADAAMYRAKREGRDRVARHEATPFVPLA